MTALRSDPHRALTGTTQAGSEANEQRSQGEMNESDATDRKPGTMTSGERFDMETVSAVWAKARPCFRFSYIRCDPYGSVINQHEYGQRTENGWVVDHIKPVSLGGADDLDNLQPLHWLNNLSKGDHWPDPRLKKRRRKKDGPQ